MTIDNPKPPFTAEKGSDHWNVTDGDKWWMASFAGPNAEQDARDYAAKLTERHRPDYWIEGWRIFGEGLPICGWYIPSELPEVRERVCELLNRHGLVDQ